MVKAISTSLLQEDVKISVTRLAHLNLTGPGSKKRKKIEKRKAIKLAKTTNNKLLPQC